MALTSRTIPSAVESALARRAAMLWRRHGLRHTAALPRCDQIHVAMQAGRMDYLERGMVDGLTWRVMRGALVDAIRQVTHRGQAPAMHPASTLQMDRETHDEALARLSGGYEMCDPDLLRVDRLLALLTPVQREAVVAGVLGEEGAQRRAARARGVTEMTIALNKKAGLARLRRRLEPIKKALL